MFENFYDLPKTHFAPLSSCWVEEKILLSESNFNSKREAICRWGKSSSLWRLFTKGHQIHLLYLLSLSDLQLHIYLLLFQQPRQSLIYRVAIEWGKSVKTLSFVLLSLPSTRIRRWILAYGLLVANALDLIGQPHKADGYYYWMKTHNLGFSADVCHFNQNTQRVGMASGNGK